MSYNAFGKGRTGSRPLYVRTSMIDITTEKLISLEEAAALIPGREIGKTTHQETLKLWARRGKLGIRLETLQAGPRKCTTVAALQRFFEQVSAVRAGGRPAQGVVATQRTDRERSRAVRNACAELERAGC